MSITKEQLKDILIDAGYAPEDIIVKSSKQIRLLTKGNERKSTMDKLNNCKNKDKTNNDYINKLNDDITFKI